MTGRRYTLVVGAVPEPDGDAFYRDLVARAVRVVAADAGAELCSRVGRAPDVVVGDMDSISSTAIAWAGAAGSEIVRLPVEKDVTDLDAAIGVARLSAEPIVLTAAFRGRIDHTLAAIGSLSRAGAGASVEEPGWNASLCVPGGNHVLETREGEPFSVIAIGRARGVTIEGARWPLTDADLDPLSGLGVSNIALGAKVVLSVRDGAVLAVRWTARAGYTRR